MGGGEGWLLEIPLDTDFSRGRLPNVYPSNHVIAPNRIANLCMKKHTDRYNTHIHCVTAV